MIRAKHGVRHIGACVGACDTEASPRFGVTADGDAGDESQSGEVERRRLAATHVGSLAVIRL